MRKKLSLGILLTSIFILTSVNAAVTKSSEEKIQWLLSIHEELKTHPLLSRAKQVFDRVLAVADKRSNYTPRLLIISEAAEPWAMCLKNGTVILTQKGLEFCYQDTDEARGDSRLAFVLGHELAHLAEDDFWEWSAFETVKRLGSKEKAFEELIGKLGGPANRKERKKKELKADEYGLLYALAAGYDPKAIADEKGKNFVQEWVSQITGEIAYSDEYHPSPQQRAAFLLAHMQKIGDKLYLFHFGVRLYQLGRYEEALDFLRAFQAEFPCREVLNNIGLVHYQLAMNALAVYDKDRAYRYKLSGILDTETRAEKLVRRNLLSEKEAKQRFRKHIREAIDCFEGACEKDAFYVPARVNLSSAYMLKGNYAMARGVLRDEDGLKIRIKSPEAANNYAIAEYLDRMSDKPDFRELQNLTRNHPEHPDGFYNLGRILSENGRMSEARAAWEKYLALSPSDVYAEVIRAKLGVPGPRDPEKTSPNFTETPFVRINEDYENVKERLKGFATYPVELENLSGKYALKEDIRILMLEDVVKLVESSARQKMTFSELGKYGEPYRILKNFSGVKTIVYDNFALDVRDDRVRTVVYF